MYEKEVMFHMKHDRIQPEFYIIQNVSHDVSRETFNLIGGVLMVNSPAGHVPTLNGLQTPVQAFLSVTFVSL
jgi:hypothetical protein